MAIAKVSPHLDWPHAGQATVTPQGTSDLIRLPVEVRTQGAYTIDKGEYPKGLVIVDRNFHAPTPTEIVDWDLKQSPGPNVTGPGWADGVVILFQD